MKCNSYLRILIFSLVFLFLLPFNTLAANYGEGNYGDGNYNVGGTPTPAPVVPNTEASAPTCTSSTPTGTTPWLYSAVSNSSNSVTLQFVNYQTPITHFVIEYGNKSGEYKYSVDNISKDITNYAIGGLSPSTTYFFRIRTGNNCATGSWSNELSTKTKGYLTFNNLQTTDTSIETVTDTKTEIKDKDSKTSKNIEKTKELEQIGYIVNIKVTNTKQKPVAGAKVTIHSNPKETTTDENGVAHFTNVESGDHKVLIAYENFTGEQSINLTGDVKEFNLNITVNEKKVLLSPFAYGVIGVLTLIIAGLVILLRGKKNIVR